MRVNARLDEESQQRLEYLTETTGDSVSHVLRESVKLYYEQVRGRQAGMRNFSRLIGKGHSGRSDISSNVKRFITGSLEAKHGLPRK